MFLGHWYVLPILVVLLVLLASPSLLPRLGRFIGRRARETGAAGVQASRNLRDELTRPDEDDPEVPPKA